MSWLILCGLLAFAAVVPVASGATLHNVLMITVDGTSTPIHARTAPRTSGCMDMRVSVASPAYPLAVSYIYIPTRLFRSQTCDLSSTTPTV